MSINFSFSIWERKKEQNSVINRFSEPNKLIIITINAKKITPIFPQIKP